MNTFRNKQFKNELDPKYAFYDCLRSCELKSNSEKSLEECIDNCELKSNSEKSLEECIDNCELIPLSKNLDG